MSEARDERQLARLAEELRNTFDRAFADPPPPEKARTESLLAIEVAGEPYALRLGEIAGVHVDRVVTPLPSPAPALLGVASFRGRVVPVWDLAAVLGHAPGVQPRWLVVARVTELAIAFAFDTFVSHFHATAADVVPWTTEHEGRARVCNAAVVGEGRPRPLVHVRALVELVEQRFARPRGEAR